MRVEPHGVGSIVHVVKRGTRGTNIVRDKDDRLRFARSLLFLNDEYANNDWLKITAGLPPFVRPTHWPEQKPLTHILAWTLMPNHFHLLLQESIEGGIAKFMQRLGGSMSTAFNAKYNESGSLFQGGYKGRTVGSNSDLQYVVFYILVKNVIELHPGGLVAAAHNFDIAWEWALVYPFSSLGVYVRREYSPLIIPEMILPRKRKNMDDFKQEAKELLYVHMHARGEAFKSLMLESW